MAQYTKHPVSAPPTAPERESTGHLLLRGYVILVLVVTFAHAAVFNLIGEIGAAVVIVAFLLATAAIAVPMIARQHPQRFAWRRLPWAALGYAALALVSVAWSQWRGATLLTWLLLATVTATGLFIAHVLTWREIIRALSSAFKWVIGLSLALELWVSLVLHGPLLPNFVDLPPGRIDPQWYWVRDNLFDGGRLQGIVGNANLLGLLSLFAVIVFVALFAARSRRRPMLVMWTVLAAYLFVRAGSMTALACAGAAVIVVVVALVMRRQRTPGGRTRVYAVALVGTAAAVLVVWMLREPLLGLLGRSSDLTGRTGTIWSEVIARWQQHPLVGNGFSSPWLPDDPAFAGWIEDHGITVFHAHNMWLDALMQLGVLGAALVAIAYLSLLWRAWFFAVDRPRWDLAADRAYSPLTLVPALLTVVLLVQGLSESTPIMLWGWMLLILLSFKLKTTPLMGVGEVERVIEHGEPRRRVP
ncbi:O-antigen ligase family protein [Microbacterium sp.]|uniref:O-antigen ligase family protein n=1 Tax=Microbacterium sp. TaxID=51671 RepID=UPI0039E2564F